MSSGLLRGLATTESAPFLPKQHDLSAPVLKLRSFHIGQRSHKEEEMFPQGHMMLLAASLSVRREIQVDFSLILQA